MNNAILPDLGIAFSISLPIIPFIIFLVATLLVILSAIFRKKGIAKFFNVLIILICSLSIVITSLTGFHLLTTKGLLDNNKPTVGTPNNSENNAQQGNTPSLLELCAKQVEGFKEGNFTNIRLLFADLCDLAGQEVAFYFEQGEEHFVQIYAAKNKELKPIFTRNESDGAVFITKIDGKDYLLGYLQEMTEGYGQKYSFDIFRFDNNLEKTTRESKSFSVAADAQGGGATGRQFFSDLNNYLLNADVCYDPYKLMGYSIMKSETAEENTQVVLPESKYLYISNCNTNKLGIVTMKKDTSWLNFRQGAGRNFDPVLIDPNDKESYVKQTQHSVVTVIAPENTTDPDYPVWYLIRITYNDRTLEGYSAQKYINVENLTKVKVGNKFKIEANTNDSGITWTSSDNSVASIDPDTGELQAKRAGVVLISVGSDSGLTDSCLIMVE